MTTTLKVVLFAMAALAGCASTPQPRPATLERMTDSTLQGPRLWKPVGLDIEKALAVATASFYDVANLDPRSRALWRPLEEARLYENTDGLVFPFVSVQSFAAARRNLAYGFSYQAPETSQLDLNLLAVRWDGKWGLGGRHGNRNAVQPLTAGLTGAKDSLWYAHPGLAALDLSDEFDGDYRKTLADLGASPVDFRTVYQDANRWEGIHPSRPVYVAWRRQNEQIRLLMLVFAEPATLRSVLKTQTDAWGFSFENAETSNGWRSDGSHRDGRAYDGILDAKGRQGQGSTAFPGGSVVTGTYTDDALNGLAWETVNGTLVALGFWAKDQRHGPTLLLGPGGQPTEVVRYERGQKAGSRPYTPGPLGTRWWWLGEDQQPLALSPDLRASVVRLTSGPVPRYTVQLSDGTVAELQGIEGRSGLVRYHDGSVFEGTLDRLEPTDTGRWLVPRPQPAAFAKKELLAQIQETTLALDQQIRQVQGQVAARQAAEDAARLYAVMDQYQRSVAANANRSGAMAGLDRALQTAEFQALKQSALQAAQGSSTLTQYEFQRALDKAVVTQDFRELKTIVVRELSKDERYRDFAGFLDRAADVVQASWEASQKARELDKKRRAAIQAGGGGGTPLPPAWKAKPPRNPGDVQLDTMMQAADAYYQSYISQVRAGNAGDADKVYQAHTAACRNAEKYYALAKDDQGGFR